MACIPGHGSNAIATSLSLLEDLVGFVLRNIRFRHVLAFDLVAGVSEELVVDDKDRNLAMAALAPSSNTASSPASNGFPEPCLQSWRWYDIRQVGWYLQQDKSCLVPML